MRAPRVASGLIPRFHGRNPALPRRDKTLGPGPRQHTIDPSVGECPFVRAAVGRLKCGGLSHRMHLYFLIPMASCVFSAVLLGSIFRRGSQHRANQFVCLLLGGATLFSFGEAVLAGVELPHQAMRCVRLSSLGWAFTGPIAIHLVLEATAVQRPVVSRLLPVFWTASIVLAVLSQTTPTVFSAVQARDWGWTYEVGPLFPLVVGTQISLAAVAIGVGVHHYHGRGRLPEFRQSVWLAAAIGLAVVLGLASHLFGGASSALPRTGSLSFLMLSLLIATASHRFGYWILAPGALEREIFAAIPNGVALLHEDGTVRMANDGMARLMGCDPAVLLGLDLAQRFTEPELLVELGLRERECELLPFSGGPQPVSVSTTRIRDKSGQDLGRVMVVANLSEVVELRKRLVTSGRLAAVGELAAGIAHEINNPLTYVRANLSMLRQEWSEMEKGIEAGAELSSLAGTLAESEELIDESLEGVDRAAAIVRDVKGFSHAGRAEREQADLRPLLDGVLRLADPQMPDSIRLEREHGDLPLISCAPQELKQVFLNLVVNASQAMPSGGTITVSSQVDGDHVVVSVADEGSGIAPDDLERIFDPFFTTKPVGEGTGLGLALSYEILRRHGGEIAVDSELGRGTRFRVRLPIHGAEPAASS
jgi:signal transduction histidine kinase